MQLMSSLGLPAEPHRQTDAGHSQALAQGAAA